MKFTLLVLLLGFSTQAFAGDLDTDDRFFGPSNSPYEDDELDRMHKKNELQKSIQQTNKTEVKVKDEFSSTTPDLMADYEARMMDDKIVSENKRRQKAILSTLASSSGAIHECVSSIKGFQGTHATVIWMIGAKGNVIDTAIKNTDIDNGEVQKCIQDVAANLNFASSKTDLYKKSHVEYTYKFKKKPAKIVRNKRYPKRVVARSIASVKTVAVPRPYYPAAAATAGRRF